MLRGANPPWSSAGGCRESWGPYIYTRTSLGTLGVGFSFISICLLRNKTDDSSAIKFSLLRTQEWLPGPHSFSQVPVSQNRDIRVGKITHSKSHKDMSYRASNANRVVWLQIRASFTGRSCSSPTRSAARRCLITLHLSPHSSPTA